MTEQPPRGGGRPAPPARAAMNLSRLNAAAREDLVAYVDGELSEERQRELDSVLSQNAVARREVARLEEVYDLLDHLPRPEVSGDFTASTMQTIRRETTEGFSDDSSAAAPARTDLRPLLWAAGVAAAVTFLAAAAAHFAGGSAARLRAEDVPVLERLDELRAVGDREFLDWLARDSVRAGLEETTR